MCSRSPGSAPLACVLCLSIKAGQTPLLLSLSRYLLAWTTAWSEDERRGVVLLRVRRFSPTRCLRVLLFFYWSPREKPWWLRWETVGGMLFIVVAFSLDGRVQRASDDDESVVFLCSSLFLVNPASRCRRTLCSKSPRSSRPWSAAKTYRRNI